MIRHSYFWILTLNKRGKTALLGPYYPENKAQNVADGLEFNYRIIKLPTSDTTRATRIIKERRLSIDGEDLDDASEFVMHSVGGDEFGVEDASSIEREMPDEDEAGI